MSISQSEKNRNWALVAALCFSLCLILDIVTKDHILRMVFDGVAASFMFFNAYNTNKKLTEKKKEQA